MNIKTVKKFASTLLLLALLLTACAPAVEQEEPTPDQTPQPTPEVQPLPPPQTPEPYALPDAWLLLDFQLADGEYVVFPGPKGEDEDAFIASPDYFEQFLARLTDNGIHILVDDYASFFGRRYDAHPRYFTQSIAVSHYKEFDLLTVSFPSYSFADDDDVHVFRNGQYTGILGIEDFIDFDDCYRELGETIWFRSQSYRGTMMTGNSRIWNNLCADGFPEELRYTNWQRATDLGAHYEADLLVDLSCGVTEEELFLDDDGVPALRVELHKSLRDFDDLIDLSDIETLEFTIPGYYSFYPESSDFFPGMEDQLIVLAESGTEEQRTLAAQMLEYYRGT